MSTPILFLLVSERATTVHFLSISFESLAVGSVNLSPK